jgi:PHS family inorganic phosphate transporter-like MFS transporter
MVPCSTGRGHRNRFLHRCVQCQSSLIQAPHGSRLTRLQLFAINLAVIMLGIVYWQDEINKGIMPHNADTAIKVATSAGAIVGQCVFGYLADLLGRKKMYGVELMIIISTTLAQALCGESTAVSIVGVIIFYRVIMGIGVGGDYPLSAVITAEFASTHWRGGIVAAVFAMQGLGQLASALMALIVVIAYKKELEPVATVSQCTGACAGSVDAMWRILIAFGGIPGWFALYYRLTIPETPRYTFDVLYDVEKGTADARRYRYGKEGNFVNPVMQAQSRREMQKYKTPRPTPGEILDFYTQRSNAIKLFGTAFSWFFLDLAFYGLGFSSASLLSTMGFDRRDNLYQALKNTATGQLVLICAGAIPGYWMTVFTVDKIGRKPIQVGGFAILTIIFCVLGFAWKSLGKIHLLVLYVLAQFFFNFGKPYLMTTPSPPRLTDIKFYRPKCNNIHQSSRSLPNPCPLYRPRLFRRSRQTRRRHRPGLFRAHDQKGCNARQPNAVDPRCHADLCSIHVSRDAYESTGAGEPEKKTRRDSGREGRYLRAAISKRILPR